MGQRKGQRSSAPYSGWRGRYIKFDLRIDEQTGTLFDRVHRILSTFAGTGALANPAWEASRFGRYMEFHSTQDGVPAGDSTWCSFGTMTWPYALRATNEFIFRFREKLTPLNSHKHRLWGWGDAFEVNLRYNSTTVQWEISNDIFFSGGGGNVDAGPLLENFWYHVIITADGEGSSGDRNVWIRNIVLDEIEVHEQVDLNLTNAAPGSGEMRVGHRTGAADWDGLDGDFLMFRIYDEIATEDQIRAMFRDPFPVLGRSSALLIRTPIVVSESDGVDIGDSATMVATYVPAGAEGVDIGDSAAAVVVMPEPGVDGVDFGDSATVAIVKAVAGVDGVDLGDSAPAPLVRPHSTLIIRGP